MSADESEMTLREYGNVLVRRKFLVIIPAILVTAVAVLASMLQTPVYQASSEVLIQPRGQDSVFEDQIINLNARAIDTEIRVIEGQAVRQRVQDDLGLASPPPPVDASAVGATDAVALRVRSTNATNAATLANAYADAYIDIRREQSVDELLAATSEIQIAIDDLQAQIDSLDENDPRRTTLAAQLGTFETTLDQLSVDAALRTGGAVVIRTAEVPTSPIEPTPSRTAVLALVVGLLIGLGLAFLVDHLDDQIRTVEDLEDVARRPVLAVVPVVQTPDDLPVALTSPGDLAVEGYRGLRTNLQFLGIDRPMSIVQVTSSVAGEGKTTTATNLAVVLARAGHRVALLDADLRRPRIHQVFSLPISPGLTDLLLGTQPGAVVSQVAVEDHMLAVYTSGEPPANPSELLSGERMRRLLAMMSSHYDYVVVDSAPILPVSDSVAIAGSVGGVIVVSHAGRATTASIAETMDRLERVSAPVVGCVLNRADVSKIDSYSYGGYVDAPAKRGDSGRGRKGPAEMAEV